MNSAYFSLLFLLISNMLVAQIPKRIIIDPYTDSLGYGSSYKNEKPPLYPESTPLKKESYFNYDSFMDFRPNGQIIADDPYRGEKEIDKVPSEKLQLYHQISIDSSWVNRLSEMLYSAKEPVLKDFYLGNETYRLIWTRSFQDNYIIRMTESVDKIVLTITRFDVNTNEISKTVKVVEKKKLKEFKNMFVNSNFWAMESYDWETGVDGSTWTLEAHLPSGYKVVSRYSPGLVYEDELILRQLGQWMINASKIK